MINAMGAWQMNKAHTFSYAVVSYWTAYLKAHYPLEFAASNMRNARSEDRALMLLREMDVEGIKYIPFDLNKSEINWCAKNGKLYGGFIALKGIGESTAKKLVEARNNNTLTQKQKEYIFKAKNPYKDIFPFHTHYQYLYDPHLHSRLHPIRYPEWLSLPLPGHWPDLYGLLCVPYVICSKQ